MPDSLVQPLLAGPLDIVGDVHGEIDALHNLLNHLGYRESGVHPEGRRLVFLGDLIDRGPPHVGLCDAGIRGGSRGNVRRFRGLGVTATMWRRAGRSNIIIMTGKNHEIHLP